MITFDPDSPWEVGQIVTFRDGDRTYQKVVVTVEHSEDGMESQYTLRNVEQGVYEYVVEDGPPRDVAAEFTLGPVHQVVDGEARCVCGHPRRAHTSRVCVSGYGDFFCTCTGFLLADDS